MAIADHRATHDLDLVDLLLLEHERQRAAFAELHAARGDRATALFRRLAGMISVHEAAEEVVLYPVVRVNFHDGHRLARLATEQERAIKKAVSELLAGPFTRSHHLTTLGSRQLLRELEEMVRVHHELEESQIIATLPELKDGPALGGLASAYEIVARIVPTRAHRHAPTRPLSNLVLGAPVAVLDKFRDRRANGTDR